MISKHSLALKTKELKEISVAVEMPNLKPFNQKVLIDKEFNIQLNMPQYVEVISNIACKGVTLAVQYNGGLPPEIVLCLMETQTTFYSQDKSQSYLVFPALDLIHSTTITTLFLDMLNVQRLMPILSWTPSHYILTHYNVYFPKALWKGISIWCFKPRA